jgi:uncharacterized membrane protein
MFRRLDKRLLIPILVLIIAFSLIRFVNLESSIGPYWQSQLSSYSALQISNGEIPYKDFNLIYPPVAHYLIAGLMSLFSQHLIIAFIFSNLMAIFSIFLVYMLGRLYSKLLGLISAFILSIALIFTENGFYLEMIAVPFILLSSYLILKSNKRLSLFFAGVLIGVAYFTKQTAVLFAIAMILFLVFKKRYRSILYFIGGQVLFTSFIIGLLYILTNSFDFLTQILYQIYHPIKRSITLKVFQLINIIDAPFYLLAFTAILFNLYQRIRKVKQSSLIFFSLIMSIVFLVFMIFKVYLFSEYYLILIIPFFSILISSLILNLEPISFKKVNVMHVLVLLVVLFTIISGPVTSFSKQVFYFPKEHDKIIDVSESIKEITLPGDNIFVDNNAIVFYSERRKTGRIYDTSGAYRYDPENEFITREEILNSIKVEKPRVIVITDRLDFLLSESFFDNAYKFDKEIDGYKLYVLKYC